jgi:hypothetical protein
MATSSIRFVVVAWLAVASAPGAGSGAAAAEPPSGMDRPVGEVQVLLGKLTGCARWGGTDAYSGCGVEKTGGSIDLRRDPKDGTVETVWLNALVEAHPRRRPADEKRSRETASRIVRALLPTWRGGAAWLREAIAYAATPNTKNATQVGGIKILVQWLQPVDLEDTYAEIVLTKRPTLSEWELPDP